MLFTYILEITKLNTQIHTSIHKCIKTCMITKQKPQKTSVNKNR